MPTISWDDFVVAAERIAKKSKEINDGWETVSLNTPPRLGETYLVKKEYRDHFLPSNRQDLDAEKDFEEEALVADNSTVSRVKHSNTLLWEYHVLFSPSYGVPVLYFNVTYRSGKRLTIDELLQLITSEHHPLAKQREIISETEHPLVRRPFFFVHPCQTNNLFKDTHITSDNIFVFWLSTVALLVGLNINPLYALPKS